VPLVRPCVGVEHDDPAVSAVLPVRDIYLIRRGIDPHLRWPAKVRRVVVAAALSQTTDLQQELPVAGELHDVGVLRAAGTDPDVALVVHGDPVFHRGPFVALAGSAPRTHHVALGIELDHRRSRHAAFRRRRIGYRRLLVVRQGSRPVEDPDVVARVYGDTANLSENPVFGSALGQAASTSNIGARAPACCAWAITPTANCSATTRIDKRADFFIAHLVLEQAYHAYGNSENDYLQQERIQIRRGEKSKIRPEIELYRRYSQISQDLVVGERIRFWDPKLGRPCQGKSFLLCSKVEKLIES
jgi:hypothetical protein